MQGTIITKATAEDKPATPEKPKRLADIPGIREAFEKHKNDETWGHFNDAPCPSSDLRALARVVSGLQHNTPERADFLASLGLPPDALSPRQCVGLGRDFLTVLDGNESSRFWDMSWSKLPFPSRDEMPPTNGLNTRRLSDVIPQEVEWLWPQRIPMGKLTLVSGDPDLGKTWTVLDVIARVTTGRSFPDSANPAKGRRHALWVSGEDEDEDTIRPRIDMLNGDPSRVHSLDFVLHNNSRQALSLKDHLDALDSWLASNPLVSVVALDPFAAFLGKVDSHRNSDVRGLLSPLMKLASAREVAIIGINHLSKGDGENAMYRGMGSIAFVAAARSSWMVTRDPKQPADRRLFTQVKNNLASENVGGLAFRVGPAHGGMFWEDGVVETTANDALRQPDNSRAPARQEAMEWLRNLLKDSKTKTDGVPAKDVWDGVKADGLCERTVKYAKKELGVVSEKAGGTGEGWVWFLPSK